MVYKLENMAQKRRNGEEGDEMTGREKKKLKINAARTITVQPTSQHASGSAGPSNANAGAKSSELHSLLAATNEFKVAKA